ncbi:MAG TPA: DUF2218 domain-containing protein [Propioniciclava sp.]|mgnify:CR=1 FL=1|jgi:hypothetical protein|uniref:DUF2218 domain-containing protein n=1 Tax=Propioniciclava sp. TaxID=2038686 RepID=UPI002BE9BDA6|nr:DUF2218 domain-containing protein [Propioniciclava sp.]HRL50564.1 DUF2218 domain-containing protein [Propioniciclava sp.]HRL78861.1 DUF2218 domain-containing protein [Propioniciclava sp.]
MVTIRSTAIVPTDRAARFGKQLSSHLGRRLGGEWLDDEQRGSVNFEVATATLEASPEALTLTVLTDDPDAVERFENVVGRHLVRFGREANFVVTWHRSDGGAGSEQRFDDPEDEHPARPAREGEHAQEEQR